MLSDKWWGLTNKVTLKVQNGVQHVSDPPQNHFPRWGRGEMRRARLETAC